MLLSSLAATAAWAQSYPVYSVSALPGLSSVTAINDSGLILGRGFAPCSGLCTLSDVPMLYDTRTGALTTLASGFGVSTQFDVINAKGQLAGSSIALSANGTWLRSVVIRQVDGSLTTPAPPALLATQTSGLRARGFNAAGQIALQHTDGMDSQGPLCGNDRGYAVGDYDTGASTLPDATFPQGQAIVRAAVWNTAANAWFDLGPAGSMGRLSAVNNRGEVVGSANGPVAAGQPYVPTPGRAMLGNLATTWPMVDLNTLLANNTAGWVLNAAVAINAGGQIVAHGASAAGSGYVLLTPVTAPADPYATVPSAPASLTVSQLASTSAVLTWTNTARNATRLVVERCKGNCTSFVAIATLPSDTARFSDASLARRITYRWRVRAGNGKGLSAASNTVTATALR